MRSWAQEPHAAAVMSHQSWLKRVKGSWTKALCNGLRKQWFLSKCQSWKVAQSLCGGEVKPRHALRVRMHHLWRCRSETHARNRNTYPALYVSPVSPYSWVQLIVSPVFLYIWPVKRGPEQPSTIIIKKWIKKNKKNMLKELTWSSCVIK